MGGYLGRMIAADVVLSLAGMTQSGIQHRNDLIWNEIDYYLQIRQVHIDTLNNMREDLRDLYEMDARKIDNSMIVTTLMLTIGFGFVVEGTFPPTTEDAGHAISTVESCLRVVYAIVAGLALVCPFWSMLCLVECKRRLDFFMDRFTHGFYGLLTKRIDGFIEESRHTALILNSNLVRHTEELPRQLPGLKRQMSCPSRVRRSRRMASSMLGCSKRSGSAAFANGSSSSSLLPTEESQPLDVADDYDDDILQGRCAILLGLYFKDKYPDTPAMWLSYSATVLLGMLVALPAVGLSIYTRCGPFVGYNIARKTDRPPPPGIPDWMLHPLMQVESEA
eukprot:TRINITY_DN2129_c1_g1_i3.p1 TRINITY_DN2129_c1_g1~~TRINITY_DN2129_c1_g1_i3.p1  ORF type:complete len:356 (-),score=74.47 TRINITY_DN2129_c1_g1_i3:158-1162(-)